MTQRLLITGARAPAALHLARVLDAAGHFIVMADSLRWPVGRASRACQAYVRLPAATSKDYGPAVEAAIRRHKIDQVIPTCEEVFHLARHGRDGGLTATLFAPSFDLLAQAHNKFSFVTLAQSMGLSVPQTTLLQSATDLAALDKPLETLVMKPVWSRFATKVHVRPRQVGFTPTSAQPWIAQDYVKGEELCAYAIGFAGQLTALSTYRPTYRAGQGAGIAFVPEDNAAVLDFVTRFVTGTGWHGQLSFDFIRQADGRICAIECNPRSTSGVHFFHSKSGLPQSILEGRTAVPDVDNAQCVKAALALYGVRQKPIDVWRDLWQMRDVLGWQGDRKPVLQQGLSLLELIGVALRHRIGLTEASTHDIAWNGN